MKIKHKKFRYYPELIGIAAIGLLAIIILLYKINLHYKYTEPAIMTEQMERSNTTDGFTEPYDMVSYMIDALKNDDLDKGLRGFPIDEKLLGINVGMIIDSLNEFSTNITYMPSQWSQFVPISSAEITGDYVQQFGDIRNQLTKKEVEIDGINLILPETQFSNEYTSTSREICEMWNAEDRIEVIVKLDINGKDYAMGMTLLKYNGFWKIDSFESDLAKERGYAGIWKCADLEYDELINEEREKQILNSKDSKSNSTQNQLLPLNYVLYNSRFGKTPEDLIKDFILCIQKNDLSGIMTYMDIYGDENLLQSETSDILLNQREAAEEIQNSYYYLFGNDYASINTVSLEELGMTGDQISNCFNLDEMLYLDVNSIFQVDGREYAAVYYFNGKHYLAGFMLKQYEKGWLIETLSCASLGLEKGQILELTDKEYDQITEKGNI